MAHESAWVSSRAKRGDLVLVLQCHCERSEAIWFFAAAGFRLLRRRLLAMTHEMAWVSSRAKRGDLVLVLQCHCERSEAIWFFAAAG
ncbi:hypothetical protein [Vreelandella salicampi]|uniref:Uncharacterized protein n=1 Tax=Vreelandella salicampi TaxID=1449798 RepID=A0A7Z0LK56_9GAMM|nr:hypothetical protein [Halomonas salicampi]NYS60334.1 hypothetical protein [Halomonas salicampi]